MAKIASPEGNVAAEFRHVFGDGKPVIALRRRR